MCMEGVARFSRDAGCALAGWTLARLRLRHAGQLSMRQPGVGKQVGVSKTPGGLLVSAVLPRRILICPSDWLCGTAFLPLTLA